MHRNFTRAFCAAAAAFTLTTAGPAAAALAAPSAMAAPFSGRLYDAAATSASDAWAVGLHPNGMLMPHCNGTVWTQTVTPSLGILNRHGGSAGQRRLDGRRHWLVRLLDHDRAPGRHLLEISGGRN